VLLFFQHLKPEKVDIVKDINFEPSWYIWQIHINIIFIHTFCTEIIIVKRCINHDLILFIIFLLFVQLKPYNRNYLKSMEYSYY
jgi:hypothetical protein